MQQTLALLSVNLRSIFNRPGPSLVVILGIGGVVAVIVSLFAMAAGFEQTLTNTGQPDRALVMRAGSTSEINGSLPLEQHQIISSHPLVKTRSTDTDSIRLASRETFVTVTLPQQNSTVDMSVPMRGVNDASFAVRSELEVVQGRRFDAGKYEMLVGANVVREFANTNIGDKLNIRGISWLVVGQFAAKGSAYESEIWVDERLLAQTWQRGDTFSSMLVQLISADDFAEFQQNLKSDRRITADAVRESAHYASQAQGTSGLIRGVGLLVGSIMAIGAIFAALNTMYAALAARAAEISTLRALGFGRAPILGSILLESALLGLVGSLLGAAIVFVLLNNLSLSTAAATSSTFTQVAFKFRVTPELLASAVVLAVGLGAIGGLFPALGALRRSISSGLRSG